MTPAEAMQAIEGQRFAAIANLASNLKTFLRIVAQQSEVEALSTAMANEPALIREVYQHALALTSVPASVEREVEGDAALATYLWLLSKQHADLMPLIASIATKPLRFFWARKLAGDLRRLDGSANANSKDADAAKISDGTPCVAALPRQS